MEIVSFEEFITSWRVVYLFFVLATLTVIGRLFNDEFTGKNYYKGFPVVEA
jgi:hypothetical protein